jgi:hypothetical protein
MLLSVAECCLNIANSPPELPQATTDDHAGYSAKSVEMAKTAATNEILVLTLAGEFCILPGLF